MRTVPVKSSNLKEIGYDPTNHELRVVFASGAVHDYSGVPADRYAGLMGAESHGKYFAEHIKPHYPAARAGVEVRTAPTDAALSRDPVTQLEMAAKRYRGEE